MMRRNRAWLVAVSAFVLAVFLGVAAVEAANGAGRIVLKRDASETGRAAAANLFSHAVGSTTDSCSGSCSCSSCSCSGSLGCCIAGCEACWDYRDDQGYCGAQQ